MKSYFSDNNSKQLIIFFNGWGMDDSLLKHFNTDKDILIFYDYRSDVKLPELSLKNYDEVYVVAWSMGVFMANQLAPKLGLSITKSIALCGSPYPVDDAFGIRTKVYDMTCKGLRIAGTDKFFTQMFAGQESPLFSRPEREFMEQIDELENLKTVSIDAEKESFKWDVAVVGMKDRIFPPKNLISYWEGKTRLIQDDMPHYPFDKYDSWTKILSI